MNRLLPVIALAVLAYPAAPVSGQSGEENAKPPIFWDGGMIPDPGFRAYVLENFDTDRDGKISSEEADAVLVIDLGREEPTDTPGIKSLEGVEYFKNLRELIGAFHPLTSLRLSENTALTKLNCRDKQLTSLDLAQNTALIRLDCHNNRLTALNLTGNPMLTELVCSYNLLPTLDLSENTMLTDLWCESNRLTSIDLSQNKALSRLYCDNNRLTTLDLSANTALTGLSCHDNRLTALALSKNTKLVALGCCDNPLIRLNLSNLAKLGAISLDYDNYKIQVITNSRTAIVSSLTRYMQSIEAEKQKKHLQQEE